MKNKLKRILLITLLTASLVATSPIAALAQEASTAPEASNAPEASSQPVASPSPEASTAPEASNAPEASPVVQSSPSPLPSDQFTSNSDEYDEDDLNADGDEWIPIPGKDYSGNVGDTTIDTGDATTGGVVITDANQTQVSTESPCSACGSGQSSSVTNEGNGANSDNSGAITSNNSSSVQIDNNANIDNNLDFSADSGNNTSSGNVGDTDITTGDANVSGVLITSANQTNLGVVQYDITEDHMGDVILEVPDGLFGCLTCAPQGSTGASNVGNGSWSDNDATIVNNNTSDTNITNNADILNNFDLVANTGDNDANKNVGDSNIETGDANVAANLINLVNSTIGGGAAFIVNIFGDLVGDIIFPDSLPGIGGSTLSASNTQNGSNSTNNADITNNNETNVNFNNYADIDNILNIDATTGGNSTSNNTGGDSKVETGDVDVNAEVLTIANTNFYGNSDEPLWLILVNNMGMWSGQIIGALTGQNYSGSQGLVFTVDDSGEIIATNSGNGAGSDNNASITNNNTNNLTVDNSAKIINNVNIDANTGGNSASKNTGGESTIKTGDVNVAASIINFVNTNLIGRTVMLGIINVFGTWIGDAVPPGAEPKADNQSQQQSNNNQGSGPGQNSAIQTSSNNPVNTGGSNQAGTAGLLAFAAASQSNQTNPFFAGGTQGSSGPPSIGQIEGLNLENEAAPISGFANLNDGNGAFHIAFNLKLLLLGFLPIFLYALYSLKRNTSSKQAVSYSHQIAVKKEK